MGRHRSDPRGLARILIAVIAVLLAIGLLVVGAIALWGALTTKSSEASAPATSGELGRPATANALRSSASSEVEALVIRVVGAQCTVFVAVPGSSKVLFHGLLTRGEERRYDEPRLNLVVEDADAAQIIINGRQQPRARPGERKTYTIQKTDA